MLILRICNIKKCCSKLNNWPRKCNKTKHFQLGWIVELRIIGLKRRSFTWIKVGFICQQADWTSKHFQKGQHRKAVTELEDSLRLMRSSRCAGRRSQRWLGKVRKSPRPTGAQQDVDTGIWYVHLMAWEENCAARIKRNISSCKCIISLDWSLEAHVIVDLCYLAS